MSERHCSGSFMFVDKILKWSYYLYYKYIVQKKRWSDAMRQNPLFIMSLSGSVIVFLYVCLYPLFDRIMSVKWRYTIIKLAMIFYLVPIPELKYRVKGLLLKIP